METPLGPCVAAHTKSYHNVTGSCHCHEAFHGALCQHKKEYWEPAYWGHTVVFTVLFLLMLAWASYRVVRLAQRRRFRLAKLSNLVLLFIILSILLKVLSLFLEYMTLYSFSASETEVDPVDLVVTIVRLLPVSLWMAASALILGFWFDVLKSNLRSHIDRRTRAVCIIGACILLLQIPAFILLALGQIVAGTLLAVLPYLVDVIGLLALTIFIGCKSNKTLSERNRKKKTYALYNLGAIDTLWVLYCICTLLRTAFGTFEGATWVFTYLASFFEFSISLVLMLLVDRYSPRKLTWRLFRHGGSAKSEKSNSKTASLESDTDVSSSGTAPKTSTKLTDSSAAEEMSPSDSSGDSKVSEVKVEKKKSKNSRSSSSSDD